MNRNKFIKIILACILARDKYKLSAQEISNKKEVIIIGAGIAGLAAARKLMSAGFQVTVLEARNRLGGRIWTDSSMGLQVEMGASIIQGSKGNPISKLTEQFKLRTQIVNQEESDMYDANGNKFSEEDTIKFESNYKDFISKLYSIKESATNKDSMESAMQNILSGIELSESEKKVLEWMIRFEIEMKQGANLKNISLKYFDEIETYAGDDLFLTNGFSEIPQILAKGLNIKTSHVVSKIEYDKKVTIYTNQGAFTSDFAIITVPLGVLKKKKITFSPELPGEKIHSIQNLGFGIINKIFLKFPKKFWLSDNYRFICLNESLEERIEFWDLNPDRNSFVLTGIVHGERAISIETSNKKEITKTYMKILKNIFGNKIPTPIEVNHSRWNSDPFCFGTGSYLSPNSNLEDYKTLSESLKNVLFFAGEATNWMYPASVHGAYLSGEREADKIIQFSKTN